ncbi:MAG: hypothetical protein V1766_10290 [Pseudomonadota bacterium]
MPAASCLRLQEVTGAVGQYHSGRPRSRASEGTEVAGSGDRGKKDRRDAAVSAQLVTAASLSTSKNRQTGGVSAGHGDDCGKPGHRESERSEVCRCPGKERKYDMPKGRYSRRVAVVCDVPEAKEVSPASGRPNAARSPGSRSERKKENGIPKAVTAAKQSEGL